MGTTNAPEKNKDGKRKDPLPVFCFHVSIGTNNDQAFFKSVSGLKYETEVIPVREGGNNATIYQLIGGVKWSNIILKQGFTKDSAVNGLLKWREDWMERTVGARQDGTITLLNTELKPQVSWTWTRGFPVKWEISEFDAAKSELAIETIEIAHEGLTMKAL